MPLRRRRKTAPEKTEKSETKTYLVNASNWSDSRVKSFLKSAIAWLTDTDRNHLYFLAFCHIHSVFRRDIIDWTGRSDEIGTMVQNCWEAEQSKLMNMASQNRIHSVSAMFYLKSQHRWKEYQTVEHQGVVVMQHDLKDLVE